MTVKFRMVELPNGQYRLGVGGGAYSNTVTGRYVLTQINGDWVLCEGTVLTRGHLSCSTNQAMISPRIGDLIIEVSGYLPASWDNPDFCMKMYEIVGIDGANVETVEIEPIDVKVREAIEELLPESVVVGLNTYHNRDGAYFVREGTC